MNFLIAKDGSTQKQVTLTKQLRLTINAGQAKPTPPVGPALGQYGVNLMDFCKLFNDITKDYNSNVPLTCRIKIQPTKQFTFAISVPTNTFFLRNGMAISSEQSTSTTVRELTSKTLYELAYIRYVFYNVYIDSFISARYRVRNQQVAKFGTPNDLTSLTGCAFKPDTALRLTTFNIANELSTYFFTVNHYKTLLVDSKLETTHLMKVARSFLGSYQSFQVSN